MSHKVKAADAHSALMSKLFQQLQKGVHCDCRLVANGEILDCHSALLSASSPYFETILNFNHVGKRDPIIVFDDLDYNTLQNVIRYIYLGEVTIKQAELEDFLATLKKFKIILPTENSYLPDVQRSSHWHGASQAFSSFSAIDLSKKKLPILTTRNRRSLEEPQQSNFNQQFEFKNIENSSAKLNVKGKTKPAKRKASEDSLDLQESLKYFNTEKPNKKAKIKNPGEGDLLTIGNLIKNFSTPKTDAKKNESKTKPPATDQTHQCSFCNKNFNSKGSVTNHEKFCKENSGRERFTCPYCKQELTRKYGLKNHMLKIHKTLMNPTA